MGGSGVEAKLKPTDFDSCEIVPKFIPYRLLPQREASASI